MRHALIAGILFFLALPGIAQENVVPLGGFSENDAKYHLYAGVHLGFAGGGINTVNAEGRKVNPSFYALPSYGITVLAPFGVGSKIGLRLDAGVSQIASKMRPYEFFGGETNWTGFVVERYSHFTIAPMINLGGFLLGAGFNFPMSGTYTDKNGGNEFLVVRDHMATFTDVRIGAHIPVWDSPTGKLNVDLIATYALTPMYKPNMYVYGFSASPSGSGGSGSFVNMVPASLRVGASYLFDITL